MSNLFTTTSLNRLTTIHSVSSLILWLGLTLAIFGVDNPTAIAKPAQSRASTPDPAAKDQSAFTLERRLELNRRHPSTAVLAPAAAAQSAPSQAAAAPVTVAPVTVAPVTVAPVTATHPVASAALAQPAPRHETGCIVLCGQTEPFRFTFESTESTVESSVEPTAEVAHSSAKPADRATAEVMPRSPESTPSHPSPLNRPVDRAAAPTRRTITAVNSTRTAAVTRARSVNPVPLPTVAATNPATEPATTVLPAPAIAPVSTRSITAIDRLIPLPSLVAQGEPPSAAPASTATTNPFVSGATASPDPASIIPSPAPAASPPAPVRSAQQVNPSAEPETTTASDLGPVTDPVLRVQGAYFLEGDEGSVRARIIGVYPLSRQVQLGAVIDVTDDGVFNLFEDGGVDITELYVAAAPFDDLPGLRFVAGQIDLTSYFDRNSFAKDRTTHFFNSVFQTNPALAAANLVSRPGALVNWTITDNLEVRAAAFSADPDLGDFEFNSFAGEVGFRVENFIIRGTYVSSEDSGANTGFEEIFGIDRGSGSFGLREGDQEEAWGINAEYFVPEIRMGIFGRYGHYQNQDLDLGADTFMAGVNFLDVFMRDDRLGLGYGRLLSNADLRDGDNPDVWELFYDARVHPNVRVGAMIQQRNEFSETFAGFRIRADFDLLANRRRSSEEEP